MQLSAHLLHSYTRLSGTLERHLQALQERGRYFVLLSCVRAGDSLCTKSSNQEYKNISTNPIKLLCNTQQSARYCLIKQGVAAALREGLVCMTLSLATREHVNDSQCSNITLCPYNMS